jgi:glycolate oxidase
MVEKVATVSEYIIERLRKIVGDENVHVKPHHRLLRARTPTPFPMHVWDQHMPAIVVLPSSTEEVVEIVKLANEYKIPIVPRGGGTGLNDGAVPLYGGILVDMKRMNKILEIDEENMTATVQPGLTAMELNLVLDKYGLWFPDNPASYGMSVLGGRINTNGWSLISGVGGHIRDLVLNMTIVLPTGEVLWVGEGGGKKIRKSSVGYNLKYLFFGAQGTLGIVTEITVDLFPKPEAELPAFFGFKSFDEAYKALGKAQRIGLRTLASIILFDEEKVEFLRRDDEAYIPQPRDIKSIIATALYGSELEVNAASKKLFEWMEKSGGKYLGEELSEGDWASRHDRYHIPYHGRDDEGNVILLTWHCEDSGIHYTALPYIRKRWHEAVKKYRDKYPRIFDDWGMFFYNNNAFRPWGDYLTEIDIGVNEFELNEETWNAWVNLKREISEATLEVGGSMSAAHGATRPGDAELIPNELGAQWELMKKIKKLLDPNNIMNPGKYLLDQAYR